jgi:hypothetical protein
MPRAVWSIRFSERFVHELALEDVRPCAPQAEASDARAMVWAREAAMTSTLESIIITEFGLQTFGRLVYLSA